MASIEEITQQMKTAVGSDSGLGKTLKFNFKDEGVIYLDKDDVTNEDKPADCTITVAKSDFDQIAEGKLDPTMAFMQGKLKIDGDMSVAMKLQPLLAKARTA